MYNIKHGGTVFTAQYELSFNRQFKSTLVIRSCHWSGCYSPASNCQGPVSITGQSFIKFVVDEVVPGQVFLRILRFSPLSIIPQMLHTHFNLNTTLIFP
jgi:hypothetical protein